jgi:hypothetical protein
MNAEAATEWQELEIPFPSAVPQLSEPPPKAVSLLELERPADDDVKTLLGNRFVCRGGGLVLVGSSGIGKSTLVIQAGICWAIGRPCFGIAPQRALKILYIQAENDEGDLCEMRDGVLENLELSEDERKLLARNFICAHECSRSGAAFGAEVLEPLLQEHSPDLVILDPALSYIGGDANKQEVVGGFLRSVLNPLLVAHDCGVVVTSFFRRERCRVYARCYMPSLALVRSVIHSYRLHAAHAHAADTSSASKVCRAVFPALVPLSILGSRARELSRAQTQQQRKEYSAGAAQLD